MRAPALPLLAILLVIGQAAALAGCIGATEEPTEAARAAEPAPEDPGMLQDASAPGWIRGTVVDDTLAPIPGARVRLLDANATDLNGTGVPEAAVDALGRFEFRDLPNARFLVRADAEGFRAGSQWAEARNGTVFEMTLRLDPVPVLEPYQDAFEFTGLLACSGILVAPSGRTPVDCGSMDPNARNQFILPLNPGAAGIVVELQWEATTPASQRLLLLAETKDFGAEDTQLGFQEGRGYARMEVPSALLAKYYPQGGDALLRVEPTASIAGDEAATDAGLALQQTFTVVATVFYHGAPPTGYAAFEAPA